MGVGDEAAVRMASRLRAIMAHSVRYSVDGGVRLAADTGVSISVIGRMLAGRCNPSFKVIAAVSSALEQQLGRRIDCREVLSFTGEFHTPISELVGCRGCSICHSKAAGVVVPRESGQQVTLDMPDGGVR